MVLNTLWEEGERLGREREVISCLSALHCSKCTQGGSEYNELPSSIGYMYMDNEHVLVVVMGF